MARTLRGRAREALAFREEQKARLRQRGSEKARVRRYYEERLGGGAGRASEEGLLGVEAEEVFLWGSWVAKADEAGDGEGREEAGCERGRDELEEARVEVYGEGRGGGKVDLAASRE